MAPKPRFGTVLYLTDTKQVLAAVTAGAAQPTVDDLVGEDGLRVGIPGTADAVHVPAELLTAARLEVTNDILDRPLWYVFSGGTVPLTLGEEPQFDPGAFPTGTEGDKVVLVWETDEAPVADDAVLGAGGLVPSTDPQGATVKLVAFEGGAVCVKTV